MPAPDVCDGPLVDYTLEIYRRAAFLEVFASAVGEYPDPGGLLSADALMGLYHVAADLENLARAVNNRVYAEHEARRFSA
jgi:hypothetical protein